MKRFSDIIMICVICAVVVLFGYTVAHAEVTPLQVANAQTQIMQSKCNLQFNTEVREHFMSQCGFTDEEAEIYRMRARGYSLVRISMETGYSESTIQGRIRKIKRKMLNI